MHFKTFTITLATASAIQAVAVPRRSRQSACSHYTIIDTRGNGTPQGPSVGFRLMNANIRMQVPGGTTYNTVYPAGMNLNAAPGTDDIVRHIHNTLDDNPDECFVLEGYSLGATATSDALPRLTGDSFNAVKAVFLIGNPERRAGLDSNVDSIGGRSTRNSNGILSSRGGIPEDWVSKTMDVCDFGDGICDPTHGIGANMQHLSYPASPSVQTMGTRFVVKKLRNARSGDRDDSGENNDSREDDRGQDDDRSQDDDGSQEDDGSQNDDRRHFDDNSQDDDSTPPYSPSPRPRRRPVMGSMLGSSWRKLLSGGS